MQGLGDEVVAVVALAGQGDEELPRLGGAGVGGDAAKGVPRTPLHQGAAGGGQDVVDGEVAAISVEAFISMRNFIIAIFKSPGFTPLLKGAGDFN